MQVHYHPKRLDPSWSERRRVKPSRSFRRRLRSCGAAKSEFTGAGWGTLDGYRWWRRCGGPVAGRRVSARRASRRVRIAMRVMIWKQARGSLSARSGRLSTVQLAGRDRRRDVKAAVIRRYHQSGESSAFAPKSPVRHDVRQAFTCGKDGRHDRTAVALGAVDRRWYAQGDRRTAGGAESLFTRGDPATSG
jgi:hypothetical protein